MGSWEGEKVGKDRHAYSYGLDDERVSSLLRKILDPKSTVIKDLNNFRKIIAGYVEN